MILRMRMARSLPQRIVSATSSKFDASKCFLHLLEVSLNIHCIQGAFPMLPQLHSNILTRSKPFRMIVKKAFHDMDAEKNGEVDKNELYMGVLMVHLKLAKFAGPAACYVSR